MCGSRLLDCLRCTLQADRKPSWTWRRTRLASKARLCGSATGLVNSQEPAARRCLLVDASGRDEACRPLRRQPCRAPLTRRAALEGETWHVVCPMEGRGCPSTSLGTNASDAMALGAVARDSGARPRRSTMGTAGLDGDGTCCTISILCTDSAAGSRCGWGRLIWMLTALRPTPAREEPLKLVLP